MQIRLRTLLTLALVVGLMVPAAGAYTAQSSRPATQLPDTAAQAQTDSDGNYTRLYVSDEYRGFDLKPGESTTFNITVENGEDHAVTISPHVFIPRLTERRPVKTSWVELTPEEATLEPDEERTVTVDVSVPKEAELAEYRGVIALTNETVQTGDRPPRPVHDAQFAVEVYKEPMVRIVSEDWLSAQVQAGESVTRSITIENRGDRAVPMNPTIRTEDSRRYAGSEEHRLERDWITIDAPARIPANSTVTVNVTLDVPSQADRGDYQTELNLGIDDPNRREDRDYWQRIHAHFQVWKQPDQPFTTTVQVNGSTETLQLVLRGGRDRVSSSESPRFDVVLVGPDGDEYTLTRQRKTTAGYVDLGGDADRRGQTDGPYATAGESYEFTYAFEDPAAGEWTVKIMPHNVIQFRYQIVQHADGS